MTVLWTSDASAAATDGRVLSPWQATGLSIDTRTITPGDLFIALTDRRDGHDFVADALAKGACGALVARVPEDVPEDAPLLVVSDVLEGLCAMAAHRRRETQARVIAVTGSVGKTSTKDMLRAALSRYGTVHAAEKSFNNHWGVPLTLARCPLRADFAVIEIGMNHPGEIAPLAELARPDVAVVTTVAAAHLEAFDSIDGIAAEKASLFGGLAPGGVAIWNADLPTSAILSDAAARADRSVSFGQAKHSVLRLTGADPDGEGLQFSISAAEGDASGRLAVSGMHHAMNAVAVLAAIRALGLDLMPALAGLAEWTPPEGRGTRETLPLTGGGTFALIDDSYNANPASAAAALGSLAATETGGGRRVAVLGDMLELGPQGPALHAGLAGLDCMEQIDLVHCAGPLMRHLWDALPDVKRGVWTGEARTMAARVAQLVEAGDVVMVKGSLGSRVGLVVKALRDLAPAADNEGLV